MSSKVRYRLPVRLDDQLKTLFGKIVFHNFIYGADTWPSEWKSKDPPQSVAFEVRGRVLVRKLESVLQNLFEQHEEYGDLEQTKRLRSEATGILLALREMTSYLPEIIPPQTIGDEAAP